MKNSEWSDKQLEELLRQMPKIHDRRHPRDIYHNLSIKKRKRHIQWVPYIAAAAALFLFFILVPNIIGDFSGSNGNQDEKSSAKKVEDSAEMPSLKMEKNRSFAGAVTPQGVNADETRTAVYDEDAVNGRVLTYWIPDDEGRFLIPVSTVVTDEEIKSWFDLYNEKMVGLQEKNWGLSDYYPMDATLRMEQDSVIVDVAANNQYVEGSTSETIFLNALKRDFALNKSIKKVKLRTNGNEGIEFGNSGRIEELPITHHDNHYAYFFYYPKDSTVPFLVPSIERYKDISSALKAMNQDHLDKDLKATLRPFSIMDATIKGKTMFLTLDKNKDLVNDENTLHSFEAILLTAKEFGAEYVVIKNPSLAKIGPFDLTVEIKVPVAPNLRFLQ